MRGLVGGVRLHVAAVDDDLSPFRGGRDVEEADVLFAGAELALDVGDALEAGVDQAPQLFIGVELEGFEVIDLGLVEIPAVLVGARDVVGEYGVGVPLEGEREGLRGLLPLAFFKVLAGKLVEVFRRDAGLVLSPGCTWRGEEHGGEECRDETSHGRRPCA